MVISAAAKTGRLADAERWFESIVSEGLHPSVVSYNSVMAAAAKQGNMSAAEAWFGRMQRANVSANRISFKTLINAAARAGNLGVAEAWFHRMDSARMAPDAIAYNTLINAARKSDDFAAAVRWYQEMEERGVPPTAITFSTLVAAACDSEGEDAAWSLAQEASTRGTGLTVAGYTALLRLFRGVGDLEKVEGVLTMMAQAGVKPDADMYATAVLAFAQHGADRKAEEALSRMLAQGLHPSTSDVERFKQFQSLRPLAESSGVQSVAVPPQVQRRQSKQRYADEKRTSDYKTELRQTAS